ncbi:MAG: hypothetical protein RL186_5 [Pseudomonadota bacterium]|jgi:hypothetical protein
MSGHNNDTPGQRTSRMHADVLTLLSIIWIVASVIGIATHAFAQPSPKPNFATEAKRWLANGMWRAGPCAQAQNFQRFEFGSAPIVEVGSGQRGEGERLELLGVSEARKGYIDVQTRVCAPVGCNQTRETYKKLGKDQMQEWHFEGRLPDHAPYVLVTNGQATDGKGQGRIFNRCPK